MDTGRRLIKVLMFTNTFLPHVGGVARSVQTLRGALVARGHEVMVVAPEFDGGAEDDPGVLRVAAITRVAGTDYSLPILLSRQVRDAIEDFDPDIIHSHHPFFLGDTALRMGANLGVPVVYTHHTRYDLYVEQTAATDGFLPRAALSLVAGYCNLADTIIAPSDSIRDFIRNHGVTAQVEVVPTGIDVERFGRGNAARMRARLGVPEEAFVVGHLGRLAAEKNLTFLAEAVGLFLAENPEAHFILAGAGPLKDEVTRGLEASGLRTQVHVADILQGDDLAAFYRAMDVFAFSSLTETQGLVLVEAMAAGTPVVALDAPGAREAVRDGENGRLLPEMATQAEFAAALGWIASRPRDRRRAMSASALRTAGSYSIPLMGERVEKLYTRLVADGPAERTFELSEWEGRWRGLRTEAALIENLIIALGAAIWSGSVGRQE